MENLQYYKCSLYIAINVSMASNIKFDEIPWNNITYVICYEAIYINKGIYDFLLKLPKLKVLRYQNAGVVYLMTYNSKFFKHKLLRMHHNIVRSATDSKIHIIFIL